MPAGLAGSVPAAQAVVPDTFNPFVAAGGYSIYVREDAFLGGSETEGAVAVGGSLSVRGDGGNYGVIHFAAGTADYTIPTVDGDPTRVLAGQYDSGSAGRLQISNAGTSDPALLGTLKLTQDDPLYGYFERGGFTRYRLAAAPDADAPPLIDIEALPWTDAATAEAATLTALPTVADYVEADMTWTYDEAAQCLADVADPTNGLAAFPTILENTGGRLVLTGVATDRPNVVEYQDIGAQQVQFDPDVALGPQNPLIVRVPAGTTVVNAPFGAEGDTKHYIFYDLSAVTGDVTIQPAVAGGRIDGSIYAPNVDLTAGGSPLDGQVLSQNLDITLGSGETHAYLFRGEVPCIAQEGSTTFDIVKTVTGSGASLVPSDATFLVDYVRDGTDAGELALPVGESVVIANLPDGTEITLVEVVPPDVPGVGWGTPVWSIDGVVQTPAPDGSVTFTVQSGTTISVGLENVANLVPPAPTPGPTPAPGPAELAESGADGGVGLFAALAAFVVGAGALGLTLRRRSARR